MRRPPRQSSRAPQASRSGGAAPATPRVPASACARSGMRDASATSLEVASAPVGDGMLSATCNWMPGRSVNRRRDADHASCIANLVRTWPEQIIVEADDDVALLRQIVNVEGLTVGSGRHTSARGAAHGLVGMKHAPWGIACSRASSCRSKVGDVVGPISRRSPSPWRDLQPSRSSSSADATSFQPTGSP